MRFAVLTAFVLFAFGAHATDGQWFEHRFGERRAYFGDWLAVCNNSGAGQCRLVQTTAADAPDSKFYRVALVLLMTNNTWIMEVSNRNLPAEDIRDLSFTIDGNDIDANKDTWKVGNNTTPNLADTVTVVNPELMDIIMAGMRDGLHMKVSYFPTGAGEGTFTVPLQGVTAGTAAIKAVYAERGS